MDATTRPVLVWSSDSQQIKRAWDQFFDQGYLLSDILSGGDYYSFHIHATADMPPSARDWLRKGVNWVQLKIEDRRTT